MTMKRETKASHQTVIVTGATPNFQSPTIIARLGRKQMTTAEYAEHRMGRHHNRVPAESIRADRAATKIQAQRGRTRVA